MKSSLALILISSLLLTTACSKNNNSTESTSKETASLNQDNPFKAIQANIEAKGPIALKGWIDEQVQEMYGVPNPYTIELDNIKHIETITDNGTEIFNWDVTLSNLSTGHSFKCEGEEVTFSPESIEPGVSLSTSCFGELTTQLEQLPQFQTQQIPTDSPIKIEFLPNQSWDHMSNLKIQSKVDAVTITGIKVNRGRCQVENLKPDHVLNLQLGFASFKTVALYCNMRDILEVEISTDQGVWTFKP